MNRPLVTFALSAYNQEKFIRDAVNAAFSQTYSPLEILLSDDCSTDRTFAIVQEMAAAYRGPHKIVLNRNPKNLGTGGHLGRQFELMSGEIYVGSAGDDVCLPERTDRIVAAFLSGGESVQCVWSNAKIIDENGIEKGLYRPREFRAEHNDAVPCFSTTTFSWLLGATAAFRRGVWDVFGPLFPGIMQEDLALALRSRLLGKIVYLPEPLVLYRRHPENLYSYQHESCAEALGTERQRLNIKSLHRQRMRDLWKARSLGKLCFAEWFYYSCVCLRCSLLRIPLDQVWKKRRYDGRGLRHRCAGLVYRKTKQLDEIVKPHIAALTDKRANV